MKIIDMIISLIKGAFSNGKITQTTVASKYVVNTVFSDSTINYHIYGDITKKLDDREKYKSEFTENILKD